MYYVKFEGRDRKLYRNKNGKWVAAKAQAFGHKSKAPALNVASQVHDLYMRSVKEPTGRFVVEEA